VIWLVIEGNPVRQFYMTPDALPELDPSAARHGLLVNVSALRSDAEGEDANLTATLDNRSGEASALLARRPPLGARARLMSETGQLFSGIVEEIRLDAQTAQITVAA
jgi:hypothetical protein